MSKKAILCVLCAMTLLLATACGQSSSASNEESESLTIENEASANPAEEEPAQTDNMDDFEESSDDAVSQAPDDDIADTANQPTDTQAAVEGSQASTAPATQEQAAPNGHLEISFTFNRAGTHASNQYAVWIEDTAGNLVKTIYVTNFTANGGYTTRPESLPQWVAIANPANSSNIDAVSGATPSTGVKTYTWNGEDAEGNPVPPGSYVFKVEGTLYWASTIVYSGQFELGASEESEITISSELTEEQEQNADLIGDISARYVVGKKSL